VDLGRRGAHRTYPATLKVARPFDLHGKRALVTGGGRGIGRAIALALAEAGSDVAITSRKAADGEPVAREIRAKGGRSLALALDVRDIASIGACFGDLAREWGTIDILVNNAGTNIPTDLVQLDEEGWDTVVDTDLKGVAFVTQAALPVIRDGGRVVNVASIYGVLGRVERIAYSAAKGGVVTLTKSLALELAPRGITVNAVGPSLIETDLTRERMRKDPGFREVEVAKTPLKRLATAEDVAGAVVYFSSTEAGFVTGQLLLVDGGTGAH
jgi:NAD(P)-dependent dehydrogenase (short-subunit alcohol dehydrogenase family)